MEAPSMNAFSRREFLRASIAAGLANLTIARGQRTGARWLAAGKHIHLDNPGGESLPAFNALLDEATRRKLTVQMGYMFRYNPAFQLCFQLARDGALGEVFSIDTPMSKLLSAAERQ